MAIPNRARLVPTVVNDGERWSSLTLKKCGKVVVLVLLGALR